LSISKEQSILPEKTDLIYFEALTINRKEGRR
jgi:hypothetical protein